MRTRRLLAALAMCAATSGCSQYLHNTFRNFAQAPLLTTDEFRMSCRNHRRAEEAWHLLAKGAPQEHSHDYAKGFKAGYADYLDMGGNGDPPAVPPFCYRKVRYQSVEGVEAVNQWYAGWKHGALMAKGSGFRELEVIPLSAPPINAVDRYGPPIELPSLPPSRVMPPLPVPEK